MVAGVRVFVGGSCAWRTEIFSVSSAIRLFRRATSIVSCSPFALNASRWEGAPASTWICSCWRALRNFRRLTRLARSFSLSESSFTCSLRIALREVSVTLSFSSFLLVLVIFDRELDEDAAGSLSARKRRHPLDRGISKHMHINLSTRLI